MARQAELFSKPKRRRPVMMHVSDAGGAEDRGVMVTLQCPKCGAETGWIKFRTVTEAKRGQPCPRCNEGATAAEVAPSVPSDATEIKPQRRQGPQT
jgi:hypothetical protein